MREADQESREYGEESSLDPWWLKVTSEMEDNHIDFGTTKKLNHPWLNKISHEMKRDLTRKQSIEILTWCVQLIQRTAI